MRVEPNSDADNLQFKGQSPVDHLQLWIDRGDENVEINHSTKSPT